MAGQNWATIISVLVLEAVATAGAVVGGGQSTEAASDESADDGRRALSQPLPIGAAAT